MLDRIVKFLTSLKLTVVLLALGIVLVFFGTVAQVNEGLYAAQSRWFRSFFVWYPAHGEGLRLPFLPGGYLVGTLLLVNLIAAHIARFKLTWSKLGINLAHLGIILLLAGQLATDLLSHESVMSFAEGETRNYSVNQARAELVFATDDGDHDRIVSIPQSKLDSDTVAMEISSLPFGIRKKQYYPNSMLFTRDDALKAYDQLSRAVSVVGAEFNDASLLVPLAEKAVQTPGRIEIWKAALKTVGESDNSDIVAAAKRVATNPDQAARLAAELKQRFQKSMLTRFRMQGGAMNYAATQLEAKQEVTEENLPRAATTGFGREVVMTPIAPVKTTDDLNNPAAILEFYKGSNTLGQWLVQPNLNEQVIEVDNHVYRFALRFERVYHPFSVKLLKTTHEVYRGTDIPKNFQSRVRIENPATKESREVDIYMNNPLRYGGLTFFQYQMGRDQMDEGRGTSALQVVRNPSWLTPYLGCGLVAVGLVVQFMSHLIGFIKKRRTA